ncbi:hypothetical protein [Streptomyces sp. NPDC004230]
MTDSTGNTQKTTPDEEIAAAATNVRTALHQLRAAATRTNELGPKIAALHALRDRTNLDNGILAALADTLRDITAAISETGHEDLGDVEELLDEAQGCAQDKTGERIDRAVDLLIPLLAREEHR